MGKKSETRTSSAESQWSYDNLLADLDISSLRFLSQKYNKDLVYFRIHNNLNDQDNAQLYKGMQQRKKMIEEELENRDIWNLENRDIWNSVIDYEIEED